MIMDEFEALAEKLKVISHPIRLCIVKGLIEKSCNVTTMIGCLDIPQSTLSQHLSKLRAAGVISGKRNGVEICYRVVDEDVKRIIEILFQTK